MYPIMIVESYFRVFTDTMIDLSFSLVLFSEILMNSGISTLNLPNGPLVMICLSKINVLFRLVNFYKILLGSIRWNNSLLHII